MVDPGGLERGRPVAQPERVLLEVVAVVAGEDESAVELPRMIGERVQHAGAKRHPAPLPIRLAARLRPAARVDTLHARDSLGPVDVAPLERQRLLRSHPGADQEHRQRAVDGWKFGGDRVDLVPTRERPNLAILVESGLPVFDPVGWGCGR